MFYLVKKDTHSIYLESYPHLFFDIRSTLQALRADVDKKLNLPGAVKRIVDQPMSKNGFISLSNMSKYSFGTCEYMSQHFRLYCYTVYTSICFSIVGLHCHCPSPRHSFTPAKLLGGFVNIYFWMPIM